MSLKFASIHTYNHTRIVRVRERGVIQRTTTTTMTRLWISLQQAIDDSYINNNLNQFTVCISQSIPAVNWYSYISNIIFPSNSSWLESKITIYIELKALDYLWMSGGQSINNATFCLKCLHGFWSLLILSRYLVLKFIAFSLFLFRIDSISFSMQFHILLWNTFRWNVVIIMY